MGAKLAQAVWRRRRREITSRHDPGASKRPFTHLRISVSDHGHGIPEDLRARMFERLERGEDAQGSGLGLAIARSYAQAQGGDLVYHDEPSATRFELVVPYE